MMTDRKRVLVTGGAGFLCSHLCEKLLNMGHEVLCADNFYNTYGPRMHPNDRRVVSNFIMQALRGEGITVFGNGSQTRSFCYVDDMVDGLIRLMNSPDEFTGPVNLGNPSEFSILELAEIVIKLTGSSSKIVFKPLPPDDPKQRQPDIALAKDKLDWEPCTPLEKGLKKTIQYFKDLFEGKTK